MKKIAIFQFWSCTPHLEISFEIASRYLSDGYSVDYYWGGDSVLFNEDNRHGTLGHFFVSQRPVYQASYLTHEKFGNSFEIINNWIEYKNYEYDSDKIDSIEGVRSLKEENYFVGTAAISSLSFLLNSDITKFPCEVYQHYFDQLFKSGVSVYQSVRRILRKGEYAEVVFFNGRFLHEAAILAASEAENTPYWVHERGVTPSLYRFSRFRPHDFRRQIDSIKELWESDNLAENQKVATAKEWFETRITEGDGNTFKPFSTSFSREKSFADIKRSLSLNDKFWVYFQSSDDEFTALDPRLRHPVEWNSQQELVEYLISVLPKGCDLVVRVHPHMMKKSHADRDSWEHFAIKILKHHHNRVVFVPSDSSINSYQLASNASKVFSSGSTIGAEAIYMGSHSISCGDSLWGLIEGVDCAHNFDDLNDRITYGVPPDPDVILPYGYFKACDGREFKFFKPESFEEGQYLGDDIFKTNIFRSMKSEN